MQNESRAWFPDGIRALIVNSDVKFLRSATLMLSLLNFRVATCMTPASALKLLSGKLKSADVVFIDALRATTCGFDFRGIVETDLCIPVIYLFSLDYKVDGDEADDLRRTVGAGTYVIKKPLDADDLSRLWSVIRWHKLFLQTGENLRAAGGGNQALPATVEALLGWSTVEDHGEDDGRRHFKMEIAGKGRKKRNYTCNRCDHGSSSSSSGFEGGQLPSRRLERMNVTEGQEREDIMAADHQQAAQQKQRGVKAAKKDDDGSKSKFQHQPQAMDVQGPVQNQWRRSLLVQPVPQMLNLPLPLNNPLFSLNFAGPSSSNVAAFAGASNTAAPAWLPLYQAPAPELPLLHQHQQPAALYAGSGNIAQQEQEQEKEDVHPSISPGGVTDAGASKNAAMAYLQSLNLGAQAQADNNDVLAAMMDMYPAGSNNPSVVPQHVGVGVASNEAAAEDAFDIDNYINYNDVIMSPLNVDHGIYMAGNEAATMQVPPNSDNCSNYNDGSSMETNANVGMSAMFSPDQYDENTMFSLDDLLGLDEAPMYPQGQQGATDTAIVTATDGARTLLNGGRNVLGPSCNVGIFDELDILDKFLMDDNDVDFLFPQDMNNGHQ